MKKKELIILHIFFIILLVIFTNIKIIIGSGESMLPTIPTKKILLCIKKSNYEVNDIILYKIDKHKVVHRITAIIDDGVITQYQTQGDGNELADRYLITKTNITCKVI